MITQPANHFSLRLVIGCILGAALSITCGIILVQRLIPYYSAQANGGVFLTPDQLNQQTGTPILYNAQVEGVYVENISSYRDKFLFFDADRIHRTVMQVGNRYLLIKRVRAGGYFIGTDILSGTIKPWDEEMREVYYRAAIDNPLLTDQSQFYPVYLDMIDNENANVWHYHLIVCLLFLCIGLIWLLGSLSLMLAPPKSSAPSIKRPTSAAANPIRRG